MENKSKINWEKVGKAVPAVGVILAAISLWEVHNKNSEDKAQEPAKLVSPTPQPIPYNGVRPAAEYIPWGPNLPTPISFRNDGKREALIKQVILSDAKWIPTPHRDNIIGAGKTICVTFEARHYVDRAGQYMLVLREPTAAPGGGQWTTLDVAFVDPDAVGQTFVGTVTVIFDGLEQKHFKNVQIDILKELPKKD